MYKKIILSIAKLRIKFLPDKIFLIAASVIIGIIAGLAAVVLKTSVHFIQEFLHSTFQDRVHTYLYLIYPLIGILLSTLFIHFVLKGKLNRGIGNVILEISNNKGKIAKHKMYSQIVTSCLTLGFGGSAGLEAPISVTGAAIGSNTASAFRMSEKNASFYWGAVQQEV